MTEDFATLDFALVPAAPPVVATAIAEIWDDVTGRAEPREAKPGLLRRLFGRTPAVSQAPTLPLTLHTPGLVPDPPFARAGPVGPPLRDSPIRLSAVTGTSEPVTLIELMEDLTEDAALCRALSRRMAGTEVFFFRYSGTLHPGAHFAMHVYRDGRAQRRAESRSARGIHAEADWTATDTGMPHPLEADSLPAPEAPAAEVMNPERQGAILSAMGVDADRLFAGMDTRGDVIVLSPLPGGAPISELRRDASGAAQLVPPPAFATAGTQTPPAAPAAQAPPPRAQARARPKAPLTRKSPDAPLPASPEAWEQEVTELLLTCVEAALPEAERVTWLAGFTAELEAGRTESALASAAEMIAKTGYPDRETAAATARMRALYAHTLPGTTDTPPAPSAT